MKATETSSKAREAREASSLIPELVSAFGSLQLSLSQQLAVNPLSKKASNKRFWSCFCCLFVFKITKKKTIQLRQTSLIRTIKLIKTYVPPLKSASVNISAIPRAFWSNESELRYLSSHLSMQVNKTTFFTAICFWVIEKQL